MCLVRLDICLTDQFLRQATVNENIFLGNKWSTTFYRPDVLPVAKRVALAHRRVNSTHRYECKCDT